jgi:hypothetical protein
MRRTTDFNRISLRDWLTVIFGGIGLAAALYGFTFALLSL